MSERFHWQGFKLILAIVLAFVTCQSLAEEEISIQWDSPEYGTSDIVHHSRIKISGKTLPNSKIYVSRKRLTIYQDSKLIGIEDHKKILDQDVWFNLKEPCQVRSVDKGKSIGRMHPKYPFVVTQFDENKSAKEIKIITEIRQNEVEATIDRSCLSEEINLVPKLYDEVAGYPDFPPDTVVVDKKGKFIYHIDVPWGIIQQSVTLESSVGKKKDFIISFNVPKEKTLNWDDVYVYLDQWLPKFWIGAGINFLSYDQKAKNTDDNLSFQSFKGPDFRISGSYPIGRRWSVMGSYKKTPGEAEEAAGSGFTLLDKEYSWDTLGIEVIHHPPGWEKRFLKGIHNFGLRAGVQHHWFPLFTANQINQFSLVSGQATMLSLGFEANLYRNRRLYYETLFRYQYPIASASDFELKPALSLDGSFGAIYRVTASWILGVYWYGQFHNFD